MKLQQGEWHLRENSLDLRVLRIDEEADPLDRRRHQGGKTGRRLDRERAWGGRIEDEADEGRARPELRREHASIEAMHGSVVPKKGPRGELEAGAEHEDVRFHLALVLEPDCRAVDAGDARLERALPAGD